MKYNSILRLSNFINNEYERRIKKVNVLSKPYLINSEPTNYCNYKCPFCPTGNINTRQGGFSELELFEKTIKQIGL